MSKTSLSSLLAMAAIAGITGDRTFSRPRRRASPYRPTPPKRDTALEQEIAAHNAAVEEKNAIKRARKALKKQPNQERSATMRNEEYDDGYDSKESFERADEDRPEGMEPADEYPPQRETNTEFVTRLMEYAKTGPLMQAVIITGLQYYASQVVAQPASKFDSAFLNGQAWVDCAAELERELEERLK